MSIRKELLKQEDIVGTWKLHSFELKEKDEEVHSWGFDTHGLLIYSSSGHMSVAINRYAPWTPHRKPTIPAEINDRNLFYAGTYFVDSGIVKHKVSQASDPNRIGTLLLRTGSLESGFLTLISKATDFTATLVWEKIS